MKKYFKFLIIALAVAIILPQVALASWWNPMSWGMWNRIFHFQKQSQLQPVACPMICAKNMLCGSDGKDYCNECLAKAAGATIMHEGSCNTQPIVGGDKDAHGCIGSAGYTWCETKQKCLRTWEESCK